VENFDLKMYIKKLIFFPFKNFELSGFEDLKAIFYFFFQRFLSEEGIPTEPFTTALFKEMSLLEETKPGPVARSILPLLQTSMLAPPPHPNTSVSALLEAVDCNLLER